MWEEQRLQRLRKPATAANDRTLPKEGVMSRSDYRTLIDRGRKAGLRTSELYQAMATRPPEAAQQSLGQADGNGFVSGYDQGGHRVYHPLGSSGRR
jgi:hypothetical protein